MSAYRRHDGRTREPPASETPDAEAIDGPITVPVLAVIGGIHRPPGAVTPFETTVAVALGDADSETLAGARSFRRTPCRDASPVSVRA